MENIPDSLLVALIFSVVGRQNTIYTKKKQNLLHHKIRTTLRIVSNDYRNMLHFLFVAYS